MDRKLTKFRLFSFVAFSLLAASAEPLLVKIGYSKGYSSFSLIFLRNIVAWLVAFLLTKNRAWVGWKIFCKVIPLAILLFMVNALTLFALRFLNASRAIVFATTTPIFVALANQQLGRDFLQKSFWLGLCTSFIGVCLSIGLLEENLTFHTLSFIAMFLAVMSSTTYRVYMESVTKELEPSQISYYIFSINGLLTLTCYPFFMDTISFDAFPIAACSGTAAVLANIAFVSSIHFIGSTRMSILDMLQRPLVMISAIFILNEALTKMQIVGCLLTLLGTQFSKVRRISRT